MPPIVEPPLPEARYTYGGDEFIFCEIAEAMSFGANFKALAICQELGRRKVDGIVEICPANASYLVRLDPDVVAPSDLLTQLKEIEASLDTEHVSFSTRVIDVPAYYDDPWTREVLMRFRDNHQAPEGTDLEYVTRINGFATEQEFIEAHHGSPYYVSMVGFVPGLPWCFQMVGPERQLEVPKYLTPRTDTPALALSHGGAFAAIYPVQGPGGYQLFAMCPVPIFDPKEELPDFQDSFVIFRVGDILKIRPIDREGYDAIRAEVEAKTYRYRMIDVKFEPQEFFADPEAYNADLVRKLYA
jgi:urea carboxylase